VDDGLVVITAAFGTQFEKFFTAPAGCRAVLFSNNPAAEADAVSKGWEFVWMGSGLLSLCTDERISSLQSKYIKFLQHMKEFPQYATDGPVTYVDHKVPIARHHIEWLRRATLPGKALLLRNTPGLKSTISDEIAAAMPQPRYTFAMPQTVSWLSRMKRERDTQEQVRIMNTGLLHYVDVPAVRPLIDEVYEVTWELGQPECQIIWAALMQPHEGVIQRLEWPEVGIDHLLP
jgi:hypothetical protein